MEERKRKSRRILIIILAALLLASVCALIWVLSLKDAPKKPSDSATVTDNIITPDTQEQTTVPTESTVPTEEPSTEATEPWQPDETLPGKAPTIRLYKRRAEDNAVFQVGSMFPGDVETQNFCVKISYKESVVVRFRANIRAGYHWVGVAAGYMTGTVSGVKVTNSTITSTWLNNSADGDKAGGVVGYLNSGSSVTGCTVTDSTITAIRDCGSVVGHSVGTVTGNTAQDCTVYYSTDNDEQIGGEIMGKRSPGVNSGNTATNVTVTKQLLISTAAELSAALNATYNSDTTIKLANDITLSGEWGVHSLKGSNNAKLVIDGNGKTIYGLTSSEYNSINGFNSNGLVTAIMSSLSSVTFKNLTVSDANLTNNGGRNAASGVFVGDINTVKVTFDTCTVTGANVTSNAYAAGFVGYVQDVYYNDPNLSCPITLKNCTVTGSTFNGGDATGALVGLNNGATNITGATVTGNTINGGTGWSAAALVGTQHYNLTATNVTVSGNTYTLTNDYTGYIRNNTYGYMHRGASATTYTINGSDVNSLT